MGGRRRSGLERVATIPIDALGMRSIALSPDARTAYVVEERTGRTLAVPLERDHNGAVRSSAVRELCKIAEVILVVGAKNSSNSNRLREIGLEEGVPSYLIADGSELDPAWVAGKHTIGLTAGASAPEELVRAVLDRLAPDKGVELVTVTEEEEYFPPPRELRDLLPASDLADDRQVAASDVLAAFDR